MYVIGLSYLLHFVGWLPNLQQFLNNWKEHDMTDPELNLYLKQLKVLLLT